MNLLENNMLCEVATSHWEDLVTEAKHVRRMRKLHLNASWWRHVKAWIDQHVFRQPEKFLQPGK